MNMNTSYALDRLTHSANDLQHSQIPGPTNMSDGVMTLKKDSVKLVSPDPSGKVDIITL